MKCEDLAARPNRPTSRFISREEYAKIFPLEVKRRRDFVFKEHTVHDLPEKVSKFLIKKYDSVVEVNEFAALENMEKPELYKVAKRKGCNLPYIGTEKLEFIEWLKSI